MESVIAYHAKISIVGSVATSTDLANSTSASLSHTLSAGRDRHVVCVIGGNDGASSSDHPTGVTYGGVSMTNRATVEDSDAGADPHVSVWSIAVANNVSAGSKTVAITYGGNFGGSRIVVFELDNVDTTTPIDCTAETISGGSVTTGNNSQTTVTDRAFIVQAITIETTQTITAGSSQTEIDNTSYNAAAGTARSYVGYLNDGAAGVTALNTSFTSSDLAGAAVSFRPRRRKLKVS